MSISFVIPAFKSAYLYDAIQSILLQTCPDWDLTIVDDCSPEDLYSIVSQFHDTRIRYLRNIRNIGGKDLVGQWNHCISYAKGEWLVLAADDDLYRPTFCEELLKLANLYPQVDLIHSSVEQIDEEGHHLRDDNILPEFSNKYEYLNWWITGRSFTCIGNFAFRRSALMRLGGFIDFPCAFGSDIATPISLSQNGVANMQGMLFCFRQSSLHLSSDASRFKEKLEGISQLSEFLRSIQYEEPDNAKDTAFYSIVNKDYLHKKCIYDYFNLVLRYVPFTELLSYLRLCRLASSKDKLILSLRWIKNSLVQMTHHTSSM